MDNQFPFDIEALLPDAVQAILELQDEQRFLDWMRSHLPDYWAEEAPPLQEDLFSNREPVPAELLNSLAALIGRTLWNATPLPANGFRPRPMPEPGRNDPCPCGSGLKFKRCCLPLYRQFPPLATDEIWSILLEVADRATRQAAASSRQVPVQVLAQLASEYLDEGRPKKALQLLDPLFAGKPSGTGEAYDYAFNVLLDTYDRLGYRQKKQKLLERVIQQAGRSPLRAGAWLRLASMRMDAGDREGAWEALEKGRQDQPNDPFAGMLEVELLLTEGRLNEARERARFWYRKLKKRPEVTEEALDFFALATEDPDRAFIEMTSGMNEALELRLLDWIERVSDRPPSAYSLDCWEEEGMQACRLQPPRKIDELFDEWQQHFSHEDAPFATEFLDIGIGDPWAPGVVERWLGWLEKHPEAFDSIEILDDLADTVTMSPSGLALWLGNKLYRPLLERSLQILQATLRVHGATPPLLPWGHMENRPALRNLGRLVEFEEEAGELEAAIEHANLLLALNPDDNQGIRAILAYLLLRLNRPEEVIELSNRYPGDVHAELPFSKALALFRLDRKAEAEEALREANEALPKVLPMLRRKSVKKPEIDPIGFRYGGDDQAWLYREKHRPLWEETPGAMDWLKQFHARR